MAPFPMNSRNSVSPLTGHRNGDIDTSVLHMTKNKVRAKEGKKNH